MSKKYDVFVSHDPPSEKWARSFTASLEANGLSVCLGISRSVLPGEAWKEAIEKALRESELMIVILDGRSAIRMRSWMYHDVGAALALGKKIIMITAKGFDQSSLPSFLQNKKALTKKSPKDTASELMAETVG